MKKIVYDYEEDITYEKSVNKVRAVVINKEGKIIIEPSYELNTNEPIFIGEYYQVIYGNGEIYYTK